MNTQPVIQPKSSTNGAQQKGGEREEVSNKAPSIKSEPANSALDGKTGSLETPFRDRLMYLTTCKIGHHVEAYLKNGSVYSGIFHAAEVEKGFGIILKMAHLIQDGTLRGHKSRYEVVRKPPSKTLIIPADELVQVVAKDLSVQSEKSLELLTDSSISKSYRADPDRELKPWVPDEDVPQPANMENVFNPTKRVAWNQFEANKSLFGVTSTFNEELYTTKLNRGPRTRGLEEEAQKIAREIEGENTQDIHVAEERGHELSGKFDMDEESKYSSVHPVDGLDDSGFDEEDDTLLDTCNDQTFSGATTSDGQKPTSSSKGYEKLSGDSQSSWGNTNVDPSCSISEQQSKDFPAPRSTISVSQLGERRNNNSPEVSHDDRSPKESVSGHGDINVGAISGGGATSASKDTAERERQVSQGSGITKSESSLGQSTSRGSDGHPTPSTSSRPGLSPSSSIDSSPSSEKSSLNPNAKEFKLNPNAKSFKPLQAVVAARPQYLGPAQQMPGMPPFGYEQYQIRPQQIVYPFPQTYYPPNRRPRPPQNLQQQQIMHNQPRPQQHGYQPPPPPHPNQQDMP